MFLKENAVFSYTAVAVGTKTDLKQFKNVTKPVIDKVKFYSISFYVKMKKFNLNLIFPSRPAKLCLKWCLSKA